MRAPERRSTGKRLLWQAARALGRKVGVDLVRRHYYSPIPDLSQVSPAHWDHPLPMPGVALDVPRQVDFARDAIAPYVPELAEACAAFGVGTSSPTYRDVDAAMLYGYLRHLKPARVVELGSGYSTLVIEAARARNRADGHDFTHEVFDPFPWFEPLLRSGLPVRRVPATKVPDAVFDALGPSDVLFVDTTHTVRLDGDVNRLVLEVLPTLTAGVVVHFHDILLPWDYPRSWVEQAEFYWAEQYLLQAFLALNDDFEVTLAAHAIARQQPEQLAQLVPAFRSDETPSAFWMQRAAA